MLSMIETEVKEKMSLTVSKNYTKRALTLDAIVGSLENSNVTKTRATELGFVWSPGDSLLTFATSAEFVDEAASRSNVATILVDSKVTLNKSSELFSPEIFIVENARLNFFRLHNSLRLDMNYVKTQIHSTAIIHPSAVVSETGVQIDEGCLIEAGVTIQPGTVVGANSIIRCGAHIGSDALDIKEDELGNPLMTDHLGGVQIGENVEIGHNSVVDRSIFRQTATSIGNYTKIGCLSNISHGVQLGARNKIAAGVKICGSTTVGEDNWIGPGAIISNLLTVGSRNYIALGANVLTNLESDWKVVGIRIFKDRKLF